MADYLNVIHMIGKAQSGLLEMVKLELDHAGTYDINNVQAMMLFNIGEAEMTIGELTLRGCYLGSNVSYNVKKMVGAGYIVYQRSPHYKRSVLVKVSAKGQSIVVQINAMFDRHRGKLQQINVDSEALKATITLLTRLDRMWGQEHTAIRTAPMMPINRPASREDAPTDSTIGKPIPPEEGRELLRFVP